MKNEIRLALLCLAAASVPAIAQNTTDSRCGSTNYDRSRNEFTITNPTPGTATQQCFITVVPKQSWTGGIPDLSSSQLVEGNYEIALSGGGGTGGKEADRGAQGGNGFIKLALKDPVPQAAPVQAAPARSETVTTPAPAAARPARRDRN